MDIKSQQIHNYKELNLTQTNRKTKQTTRTGKNHRYGDHLDGYQLEWGRGEWGMVQGLQRIIGRNKIDKGKLRITYEIF